MNIIVSTHDSLAPIKGGGALRTIKAAEELKKRGHNVTIIAPADDVNEISGIRLHWLHAPRKHRSQILSSLKFNIRLLRKFLQFAKQTDMFFVHNTIAAATLPFLKYFFNFKFILDITDVHAEYFVTSKKNIMEKLIAPVILKIEYWIINSADHIIVVTKAMKELLIFKNISSKKIEVIYDAAEINQISPKKEGAYQKNIIHLGTVDKQHNVEVFINAMPYILEKCPNAKFLIVGGGRELNNIIKTAKNLGVYDSCHFTDYLPCEQARKYLKNAAIGIIPRNDNLPNRIVTTLKLYEYWAGKTAVISSELEGIAEIAKNGKDILFFKPGSPKNLAEKIIFLLENPDLANKIANEGAITVKKYTWENTAPLIANVALKNV